MALDDFPDKSGEQENKLEDTTELNYLISIKRGNKRSGEPEEVLMWPGVLSLSQEKKESEKSNISSSLLEAYYILRATADTKSVDEPAVKQIPKVSIKVRLEEHELKKLEELDSEFLKIRNEIKDIPAKDYFSKYIKIRPVLEKYFSKENKSGRIYSILDLFGLNDSEKIKIDNLVQGFLQLDQLEENVLMEITDLVKEGKAYGGLAFQNKRRLPYQDLVDILCYNNKLSIEDIPIPEYMLKGKTIDFDKRKQELKKRDMQEL